MLASTSWARALLAAGPEKGHVALEGQVDAEG